MLVAPKDLKLKRSCPITTPKKVLSLKLAVYNLIGGIIKNVFFLVNPKMQGEAVQLLELQ